MGEQQDAESDRGHATDSRMLTANTLYRTYRPLRRGQSPVYHHRRP